MTGCTNQLPTPSTLSIKVLEVDLYDIVGLCNVSWHLGWRHSFVMDSILGIYNRQKYG